MSSLANTIASSDSAPRDGAPRVNRRQAAKIRTRGKVLDAARTLFAERGYDPATIRDIARGADMSTGAVFANFQDKAELFETVLTEDMERLATNMIAGTTGDTVMARLVSALNAGYYESIDQLPLFQAIFARGWFQPLEAEVRARAAMNGILDHLNGILRKGVADGELKQDVDVPLLVEMVWTIFQSNYRHAAYQAWTMSDIDRQLTRQISVLLAGSLTGR